MLPRWHIVLGAIFTIVLWLLVPTLSWQYLSLVFLSSFLIDFDHYLASVMKTNKWSLNESFKYHDKLIAREKKEITQGLRKKSDFHFFHTVEFHALIGILGFFISPLFFIFLGMTFHSLLDVISMSYDGTFHRREYFFFNWMKKKLK